MADAVAVRSVIEAARRSEIARLEAVRLYELALWERDEDDIVPLLLS